MNMDIDVNNLRQATSPNTDRKTLNQTAKTGSFRSYLYKALDQCKSFSRSVRIFLFDMALVEGTEKHSGQLVKTLYVGETETPGCRLGKFYSESEAVEKYANFKDVMDSIYSDYTILKKKKNINGLNISKRLRRFERMADMAFIDIELLFTWGLDRRCYLAIPQWVTLKFILADKWEDVMDSFPKPLLKKIKRILKHKYSYCTGNRESQFDYFYHKMYLPYTQKRFGNAAVIYSKEKLKKILPHSEIIFLFRNNRLLLGNFNTYNHDRVYSVCSASANNLQPEMFKGASEAMDYFSILCAFEKGCRVFDFMGSRPILTNGAFRYKRKWGACVDKFYRIESNIYFKPLHMNEGVKSYLIRNPFITDTSKGLKGRILLDVPVNNKDIKNWFDYYQTKGMNGIDIFCAAGIQSETDQTWYKRIPGVNVYDISKSRNPEQAFCMF